MPRRNVTASDVPPDMELFEGATAVVIRSTWGYYRAADSFRDFFVHQALEYTGKDVPFPFSEPLGFRLLAQRAAAKILVGLARAGD